VRRSKRSAGACSGSGTGPRKTLRRFGNRVRFKLVRPFQLLGITLVTTQFALFACATAQDQTNLPSGGAANTEAGASNSSAGASVAGAQSAGAGNGTAGQTGGSGAGNTAFGGGAGTPTGGASGNAGSAGASSGSGGAAGGSGGATGSGGGAAGGSSRAGAGGTSAGSAGASAGGAAGSVGTCGASTTLCAAGQTCTSNADCSSTQCVTKKCAPDHCGNTVMDGDETDKNCGGSCAPCASSMACVADSDCVTKNCTAMVCGMSSDCLVGWEMSNCDTCSTQTQSDHKSCSVVLQCYEDNSCTPTSCGGLDQVCGQNKLQLGTAAFPIAQDVYSCRCPAAM
jgi:hypothetical protein